ncbi:MAG: transcription-repair coupling factor [Thermodesulfobacteriota bacterium]
MNLIKTIHKTSSSDITVSGLNNPASGYIISKLKNKSKQPLIVLASDESECETLFFNTQFFLPDTDIRIFPGYSQDNFKSDSLHPETAATRIKIFYDLSFGDFDGILFVPYVEAFKYVIPKNILDQSFEIFGVNEDIKPEKIAKKLVSAGYTRTSLVEEPGDFAVRGGIIDLFSPVYENPVRLEFFGDSIESVRSFSVNTQRKIKDLSEVLVIPVSEVLILGDNPDRIYSKIRKTGAEAGAPTESVKNVVDKIKNQGDYQGIESILPLFYDTNETIFNYISAKSDVVITKKYDGLEQFKNRLESEKDKYYNALESNIFRLHPRDLYADEKKINNVLDKFKKIELKQVPSSDNTDDHYFLDIKDNSWVTSRLKSKTGSDYPLSPLSDWISDQIKNNMSPVIVCSTATQCERLISVLKPYGITAEFDENADLNRIKKSKSSNKIIVTTGRLSEGFVFEDENLALISENEIFGLKFQRRKKVRKLASERIYALNELSVDDIIVHTDHGLGQYKGLEKINISGMESEFAVVEYFDNDRLYIPVDRINLIQKYVGKDSASVNLDKLGSKDFSQAKEKARKKAEKIAKELLSVYAKREVDSGHSFSPPDDHFRDFEATFPYVETNGQIKAINDVINDMKSSKPMDRLVCGDVGYGKTEVAVRAAFKAWTDSTQTAVLVPTTILAEQHLQTFRERFKDYPVNIHVLNRFKTKKEQEQILKKMGSGEADIVIGTHRLLQKDIKFESLGLLVIDEEQRFGVKHKEKIKSIRSSVDVLTLTATPIPRTLHFSLSGIRDISIISTPPEARQPINTYISGFDENIIKEAVLTEVKRGGQVYFVHNNVSTIDNIAGLLSKLLPNINIGVAHGQMPEKKLEEAMKQFIHKKTDVLVCTTIVESGLDISDANTMIVNRADRFGLSQLYQLRGRIGRGKNQAYAYLFVPEENRLTKDAQKRLKVLMQYSDLGAGFQLAMGDLQIRGAGDILGASQSGHVSAIGYDLFLKLLENEVSILKGEEVTEKIEPEINLGVSAYIPESYIPDIDQRMILYRRLTRLTQTGELKKFKGELEDRYGKVPRSVENLLLKIMFRILCIKCGIVQMDMNKNNIVLQFSDKHIKDPDIVSGLAQANKNWKLNSPFKLVITPEKQSPNFGFGKKILMHIYSHVNEV